MFWFTGAISAAAIMGLVSILDSHLISKRLPSLWSFLLPVGILQLGFGLIILSINPLPEDIGISPIIVAFISGIIRTIAAILMLKTMRSEEVSRVISVTHTFPIFVAIIAVPILDEALGYTEWLAIFVTVAGAVLISIRWGTNGQNTRFRKSFITLIVSSLLFGAANVASKYSLDYISFWNMCSVNAFCFGAVFLMFSLRPRIIKELRNMKHRNYVFTLLNINEFVALGSLIMSFWAIEQGPVSLVSAIISTRPGFVFIYTIILSRISPSVLNEHFNKRIITVKIISIGLIVGGVTLLTLG